MKTIILSVILLILSSNSYAWIDITVNIYLEKGNVCIINGEDTVSILKLKDTLKNLLDISRSEYPKPITRRRYVEYFGETETLYTFVSLATSSDVEYGFYIQVQNEIERAYFELRNELSLEKFNHPYDILSKGERNSINKVYRKIISEAEPEWWWKRNGYAFDYYEGYVKE